MKYTVNLTGNKTSKDGSILGKIYDFKYEMEQHEKEELNNYKKHPHMSACDRTSIVHNRYCKKRSRLLQQKRRCCYSSDVAKLMFSS